MRAGTPGLPVQRVRRFCLGRYAVVVRSFWVTTGSTETWSAFTVNVFVTKWAFPLIWAHVYSKKFVDGSTCEEHSLFSWNTYAQCRA